MMRTFKYIFLWGAGVAMIKVAILSSLIEIGYSINYISATLTIIWGVAFISIASIIKEPK